MRYPSVANDGAMKRKILQRYTLGELVSPTLLGLAVFTFILLATHLFRLTDLLINRGVPLPIFAQFVGTLVPPLLMLTTPMALLVGVLLGVGRLAADSEIMAMRTSGVHLLRVFLPVLIAAVLMTGILWRVNGYVIPGLVSLNMDLLRRIQFIVASRLEAGRVFNPKSDMDVSLYFRHRNPVTHLMEGITLKVVASDSITRNKTELLATSNVGWIVPDLVGNAMDITLTSGTLHHFDSSTTATDFRYSVAQFKELRWRLQLQSERKVKLGRLMQKPREMTSRTIAHAIKRGFLDPEDAGALEAEIVQRRSIAISCVAFAVLGVPLAIRIRPTGKAVAFSIAFGLIFFYYIMLKWGVSLSQNGSALGALVIFLPNVLVGGVGLILFYRTLRQ